MVARNAKADAETAAPEFNIEYVFDAPRTLVFEAWTEAAHLGRWWGPKGSAITVHAFDLRPGGMFHYSMRLPDGRDIWGKFVYREIVAPERIVFVNFFSDAQGGVTRNPWMPDWPLEMLNILTLSEHAGRTTLTLRGSPIDATEIERKTYEQARPSLERGFAGTWEKLVEHLKTMG